MEECFVAHAPPMPSDAAMGVFDHCPEHARDDRIMPPICRSMASADPSREHGGVILFDSRRRNIHAIHFEGGTADLALPYRMIVAAVLEHDCSGVILHHSHPSGDPRPSRNDIVVTRTLWSILRPLDVRLYDHVIVSGGASFSFRAEGLL